jgi:hypothetical protein
MGRFQKFTCQILPGEVQLFVQVSSPLRAIGDVVHDALIGDQFSGAALACAAAEFHFCDDVVWNAHAGNYTGYLINKNLLRSAGDFLWLLTLLYFL